MDTLRILRLDAAPMGGWWLAFAAEDSDAFYEAVAAVRSLGSCAHWEAGARAWWLSSSALPFLARLLPALAARIAEAERDRDKDSAHSRLHSKRRYRSRRTASSSTYSAAPSSVPSVVASAFAALYVRPDAPLCVVRAAYRALARELHPDVGGDTEMMKRLNLANETATRWIEEHSSQTSHASAYAN